MGFFDFLRRKAEAFVIAPEALKDSCARAVEALDRIPSDGPLTLVREREWRAKVSREEHFSSAPLLVSGVYHTQTVSLSATPEGHVAMTETLQPNGGRPVVRPVMAFHLTRTPDNQLHFTNVEVAGRKLRAPSHGEVMALLGMVNALAEARFRPSETFNPLTALERTGITWPSAVSHALYCAAVDLPERMRLASLPPTVLARITSDTNKPS